MTIQAKPTTYTKVWAATGSKIAAEDFKISRGWEVEKPPFEVMNWLQNRQDQWIAHTNQRGIAQWDANTEYKANVSYVTGATTGVVYRAVTDSVAVNPETDMTGKWVAAFDASQYAYSKAQSDAITAAERVTSNGLYLKVASNFADLSNLPTARNNLSVFSKAEVNSLTATERSTSDAKYTHRVNNLSDLTNTATARTNLNVFSKTETYAKTETYSRTEIGNIFLSKADNLASLVDKSAARTNLEVYSKVEVDDLLPAGEVRTFAANINVPGFIPCDGRSLSRAAYPRLFAAIGTAHGSVDSNSFNVPDYRGVFLRGFDAIGGAARDMDRGRIFPAFQKGTLVGGYDDNTASANVGVLEGKSTRDYGGDRINLELYTLPNAVYAGDTSRIARPNTDAEAWYTVTRPVNMPVYFYIRA